MAAGQKSSPGGTLSPQQEATMPMYRAYLMDSEDHITSVRAIEADSDADALESAKRFADKGDVEVWLLDHKVGRVKRVA